MNSSGNFNPRDSSDEIERWLQKTGMWQSSQKVSLGEAIRAVEALKEMQKRGQGIDMKFPDVTLGKNPETLDGLLALWDTAGIPCIVDQHQMAWPLYEFVIVRTASSWDLLMVPDWSHPENPLGEIETSI
jgi:hypothetical protein